MEKKVFIIGSKKDICDIVYNDPTISRNHCSISRNHDGVYCVQDLKSRNGTIIIRHNEKIRLNPSQPWKVLRDDNLLLGETTVSINELIAYIEKNFPGSTVVKPKAKKRRCHCGKVWIELDTCPECGLPRWDKLDVGDN